MTPLPADLDDKTLHALIEVMFLAAMADEELSAAERTRFVETTRSLSEGRLSTEALDKLTDTMAKDLAGSSVAARLETIRARLPDQKTRTLAFSLAVQVANADAIVRTSERELLFELAEGLELSRDEAADLVKKLTT